VSDDIARVYSHGDLTIVESTPQEGSPFDAIRQFRADSSEFWSARALMPLMGYAQWQNLETPIRRAMKTAENQDMDVDILFMRSHEKTGGRPREDFELARYAAYLVAMNGDPNIPEVAAAQHYFAVRTREAETSPPALTGPALIAAALIEANKMIGAKDERIAELEPKAEMADRILDADSDLSVADIAKALTRAGVKTGQKRLFDDLDRRGWIYRGKRDGRWRVMQSSINSGWMSVLPQSYCHPRTGILVLDVPQPRVTPKGLQRLLADYGAKLPTAV